MLGHSLKTKPNNTSWNQHTFLKNMRQFFYFNKSEVKSFFFVIYIFFFFHKAFKNIEPRRKPVSMKGSVIPASRKCSHSRTCLWWLLHSSFKNIHLSSSHIKVRGKKLSGGENREAVVEEHEGKFAADIQAGQFQISSKTNKHTCYLLTHTYHVLIYINLFQPLSAF